MGLCKIIADFYANVKEYDEFIAKQNRDRIIRQRYWQQYWFIALVLYEAIYENRSLLQVHVPSEPKSLNPPNCTSKYTNEFWFRLIRNPQNTPSSDVAVSPYEIITTLTDYFHACGFANFKILCNANNFKYHITFHMQDKFCFGYTLSFGIGEIFYNRTLYNDYTYSYGMYDIGFYNGGTCGGLSAGRRFKLYFDGGWSETEVIVNANGLQMLTLTNKPLENYIGWIARI